MSRKPRVLTECGFYHVIVRGNNRQPIFMEPADFKIYLELIRRMKAEYKFELFHYRLMTNHAHLLIKFYDSTGLQKVMQRVNLTYAKRFRKIKRYVGHVFQDRFKSFPIERDSYLLECGRYIERNPVRAGLVRRPEDYFWCSAGFYTGTKEEVLLTENPLYADLGSTEEERKYRYREFLEESHPYENLIADGLLRG